MDSHCFRFFGIWMCLDEVIDDYPGIHAWATLAFFVLLRFVATLWYTVQYLYVTLGVL